MATTRIQVRRRQTHGTWLDRLDRNWCGGWVAYRQDHEGLGIGVIMDMVVGLIGALIGGFVSTHLGFGGVDQHGLIGSILIAMLGAVLLTILVRLISGNRSANL
jgi:uncharacterized membrane protein YeaQ/YmgE (transglycosylase-associated protein family)